MYSLDDNLILTSLPLLTYAYAHGREKFGWIALQMGFWSLTELEIRRRYYCIAFSRLARQGSFTDI